jgi:SAM-dependent methyltransferase
MKQSKGPTAIDNRLPEEQFKPVSVKPPTDHPFLFTLRCLVDLQLSTIVKKLRPALAQLTGNVLDVGAGQSPWREWLPRTTSYQGIDIANASEFGMVPERAGILYYDGRIMPLCDRSFDSVLCIEVLEHAEDPELLLCEIARVLKENGTLLLTVPWSARQHHLPSDYHRFTSERLRALLGKAGFDPVEISERGNDIGAIANKLTVLTIRLFRPPYWKRGNILWQFPLGLLCGVLAIIFIGAAHCSDALGMGSKQDPLGYFVRATRRF